MSAPTQPAAPSTTDLPSVLVADDHQILLDVFTHLVESVATVVGTATNGEDLI
ncbi:MAG: hypothetical protein RLZZ25_380, partial [Gemmatimonadota bacterium]